MAPTQVEARVARAGLASWPAAAANTMPPIAQQVIVPSTPATIRTVTTSTCSFRRALLGKKKTCPLKPNLTRV